MVAIALVMAVWEEEFTRGTVRHSAASDRRLPRTNPAHAGRGLAGSLESTRSDYDGSSPHSTELRSVHDGMTASVVIRLSSSHGTPLGLPRDRARPHAT